MFGMFQGRDRALSSPASGSGLSRRIVRVIIPSGCWVCNSNSAKKQLLSGSGLFQPGHREQLFGIGVISRWAHRGASPDLPRQQLLPPGEIPCPAAPGMTTRTIVRKTPGCPAVPGGFHPVFSPAYRNIKKFILGVDIIYSLG